MGGGGFLLTAVYSALLAGAGYQVAEHQPEPYMDEIFHVPQARAYCAGNYTQWDPKITTLPGLYLFTVGLLRPLHFLSPLPTLLEFCSTTALRSVNMLVSLTNLLLLSTLTWSLHGHKESYSATLGLWSSLNLSLLPPLLFSSLLYYTDPLATCLVLLTYSLHLTARPHLAALAGGLAVLCRQTNIAWVFLVAAETAGRLVIGEVRSLQAATGIPPTIALTAGGQAVELVQGLGQLAASPRRLAGTAGLVVAGCLGYLAVGGLFLAFVHLNQGVVVGDRAAHTATLHLLQLCYFSAFYLGATLPWAVRHLLELPAALRAHPRRLAAALALTLAAVHWGTVAHPYLLADNRHFTFYLWRRVYMRHWACKYLLVPLYILGFYHLARSLGKSDLVTKLMLPLCLVVAVVPQLLLEFRYFILPFIFFRLQVRPTSVRCLAAETAMMVVVNLASLALFLYRPFTWESEPGVLQRFMW